MTKHDKLIFQILQNKNKANIAFTDLVNLLQHFEFDMRIKGSHHIFRKNGVIEKIKLAERREQSEGLSGSSGM